MLDGSFWQGCSAKRSDQQGRGGALDGNKRRQLADFIGCWRLERRIEQVGQPEARFEGTAEWRTVEGGADYSETGHLTLPDQTPIKAERRYFWDEDLRVHFADGRFFHAVPPEGGESSHWCDPDQYEAHYDFSHWPRFTVIWQVKGPRKEYRMIGHYTPEET